MEGEAYPDPARLVSVGPSVTQLLDAPDDPAWENASVELCGGTHVANTAEAVEFALVEESGVAKGVRRVTALTGEAAAAAHAAASELEAAVRRLDVPASHVADAAGVAGAAGEAWCRGPGGEVGG